MGILRIHTTLVDHMRRKGSRVHLGVLRVKLLLGLGWVHHIVLLLRLHILNGLLHLVLLARDDLGIIR